LIFVGVLGGLRPPSTPKEKFYGVTSKRILIGPFLQSLES
jgi:hypothetical protein